MCGIAAYIGKNVKENLLKILKSLEYRGYDSAGMAYFTSDELKTIKCSGKVKQLEDCLDNNDYNSLGIAHTRWATHGAPTKINAHPHTVGNWTIVHNGVIENYRQLNTFKTVSETDTEVIAHLLNQNKNSDNIKNLIEVCNKLTGSFALACINSCSKNEIYLAKRKSPLYIAVTKSCTYISSDITSLMDKCEEYYIMEDDEFAVIKKDKILFYNNKNEIIIKKSVKNNRNYDFISSLTEDHFMLSEIKEIYSALVRTITNINDKNLIKSKLLCGVKDICFIGCGTAYHSGLMIAKFCETKFKIKATSCFASEFNNFKPLISKNTLYIIISQSGETADSLLAIEKVKSEGGKTLAITNVPSSTITRKVDQTITISAGKEIAVASTKAYNCQILCGLIISYYIFCKKNKISFNKSNLLDKLVKYECEIVKLINRQDEKELAKLFENKKECIFIGRHYDYITSQEASLKLKEISYINSSAFPAGELKHGTLALIEKGSCVVVICTQRELITKIETSLSEVKSRGATTILLSPYSFDKSLVDYTLTLPNLDEELMQILSIIPMQKLAYYVSLVKELNPDKPRNLAKSVTVE